MESKAKNKAEKGLYAAKSDYRETKKYLVHGREEIRYMKKTARRAARRASKAEIREAA